MAMVCPQCQSAFEQQLECPTCAVRLLYEAKPRPNGDNQWQQTPWGRIIVGLLLAQGLAHGLQLLTTAGYLASDEHGGQTLWSTLTGILLLHGMYGLSLLLGGAITGAGQQRGLFYGSFVGLVNGLIFLLVQLGQGVVLNEVTLYSEPILHLAFGALGGLIGTLIWKPLPSVRLAAMPEIPDKARLANASASALYYSPICWTRALAGIAVVVAGVAWAPTILRLVLEVSQGKFAIDSHIQAKLVTWEIAAVAALIGAGLAGATTVNGLKQGLVVGFGASVVLTGIYLGNPKAAFDSTVFLMTTILVVTLVGGWFGGQLFPPLAANCRRKRMYTATS